jgi:hypothetical protein
LTGEIAVRIVDRDEIGHGFSEDLDRRRLPPEVEWKSASIGFLPRETSPVVAWTAAVVRALSAATPP